MTALAILGLVWVLLGIATALLVGNGVRLAEARMPLATQPDATTNAAPEKRPVLAA